VTCVSIVLGQYALNHLPTINDVNLTIIHTIESSPEVPLSFYLELQVL
jgi:hypothetical protein